MKARVRQNFFLNTAQSAGMEFSKSEFRFVPDHKAEEISNASFLEILVEEEINASDVAVQLAADAGIDLRIVEGSGLDGKIIKGDIEKLMKPEPESTGDDKPKIKVSPSAKELAAEHEIDLSEIEGSGAGGNIIKSDIIKFIAENVIDDEDVDDGGDADG